jgi:hypothetical protein
MQMTSMLKRHRWQDVVAAATYASADVMVNSSSCSDPDSHFKNIAEPSSESMYQRLESGSQRAPELGPPPSPRAEQKDRFVAQLFPVVSYPILTRRCVVK